VKDGRAGNVELTRGRNGPSEFEITGSLRDWSAVERVKSIVVPTLVVNGTNEGATDEAVRPFVEGIRDVKWVKFGKSLHMPMYEEPERYFVDFLSGP
jgi:L-proline amide hydrolase